MNTKETDYSLWEKKIRSDKVYSGALLEVYKDQVLLPDGRESVREWIDHPGAAAVLPVFESGEVQLVTQFRYPLGKKFLEVPAGKIDSGEAPIVTAKRELKEEAGITGRSWASLGSFHPSIGYTNEVIYLFVAWGLEVFDSNVDDDEFLKPVRLSFQEAIDEVYKGEISDGKTIANLLRAAKWWTENKPFHIPLAL